MLSALRLIQHGWVSGVASAPVTNNSNKESNKQQLEQQATTHGVLEQQGPTRKLDLFAVQLPNISGPQTASTRAHAPCPAGRDGTTILPS